MNPVVALAAPPAALSVTIVLAFVAGEFVIPEVVRNRLWARLWSFPVYTAAILWAFRPELALLGLTFAGLLTGVDLLESRVRPRVAGRKDVPPGRLAWAGAVLGLRLAALCAFLSLVGQVPAGRWPDVSLPVAMVRVLLWAAAYLFVVFGGSTLVGEVLDASSPGWRRETRLPGRDILATRSPGGATAGEVAATLEHPGEHQRGRAGDLHRGRLEEQELHRGRMIGNIERLIVMTLVSLDQFGAIGLVLAAKSLARFPLLSESRDFAEYYLIGTLASMAVAIGSGLVLTLALGWLG